MTLPIRLGLCVLSAVLMVLSVPRFDLWPLMWIGLLPALPVALAALLRGDNTGKTLVRIEDVPHRGNADR